MSHLRRDLRKRFQHKSALVHRRVRNRQSFRLDGGISKQQDVDIDASRTFLLNAAPPHLLLERQDSSHQLLRHLLGVQFVDEVKKPGLSGKLDWLRLVERGNTFNFAEYRQSVDR